MEGWISLHRKILENPVVCKDSDHVAIWIYLLLNATHTEQKMLFGGKAITLQPGQLITGRKSISEKFKISESKVQRVLKSLEIEQQIEQQTNNQHRLVSIVNWAFYQDIENKNTKSEQQNEQRVNNNRTTSEQRVNTNNNDNNGFNVNNGNNEKHKPVAATRIYFSDELLNSTFIDFISMRSKLKNGKMTERAIDMMINKLLKLDTEIAIRELERSILNNWKDIYPENKQNKKPEVDDVLERWARNHAND